MSHPPTNPKLYHTVHVDRLASIVTDGRLLCDAAMAKRPGAVTTVGMTKIKQRRLWFFLQPRTDVMIRSKAASEEAR